MKSMKSFVIAVAVVAVLAPVALAQDMTAEQILDKNLEVTGGKAAHSAIKNTLIEATIEIVAQGMTMEMLIATQAPNMMYTEMKSEMLGVIKSGCDGEHVWDLSAMSGPVLREGLLRDKKLREVQHDRGVNWRKYYDSAELVGVEDFEDRKVYKIKRMPKPVEGEEEVSPEFIYIDTETFMLAKSESTVDSDYGKLPMEQVFGDYRKVDGVIVAHEIYLYQMGQEMKMTINSIKNNTEIPAEYFALPSEIQELLKEK